ncbi:MAG: RHS repeat protein, partial [Planctomycetaceae bacterium]|nr:RHS repeat protein [Planctomycetaceae bacterium]
TYKDGTSQTFTSPDGGRLRRFTTADGHHLDITPDTSRDNVPQEIVDVTSGRKITLTYTNEGTPSAPAYQVDTASTTDGASTLTWDYSYVDGYLTEAVDPEGKKTTYVWSNDELTNILWPRVSDQRSVELRYDTEDRVDRVTDGRGYHTTFDFQNETTTVVTDQRANDWTYGYEASGRTTSRTDPGPSAGVTSYTYEGAYRTGITDAEGNTSALDYDGDGNLLFETNGEGETTYYRYDTDNYADPDVITGPSHVCDARSSGAGDATYCTEMTYDGAGRMLTRAQPGGGPNDSQAAEGTNEREEWVYTDGTEAEYPAGGGTMPAGLLEEYRDGNTSATGGEGVTRHWYDAEGDLRKTETPSGLVTEFDHDDMGRLTSETVTYTNSGANETATTSYEYDDMSRLTRETGPSVVNEVSGLTHQLQVTYIYDANGFSTHRIETDLGSGGNPQRIWQFWPDELDREIQSKDPENDVIDRVFDPAGNVTKVIDANNNEVETTYTEANQVDKVTAVGFDDGHANTGDRLLSDSDYYDNGLLWRLKEYTASGEYIHTEYVYDGADRATGTKRFYDFDGTPRWVTIESNTYDDGYLDTVVAGDAAATNVGEDKRATTYTYDRAGRVRTETSDGRTGTYTYDWASNITNMVTTGTDEHSAAATTASVNTEYNSAGWPITVTVENGTDDLITTTDYDERGLSTETVSPRGNETGATPADYTTVTAYDVLGRPTVVTGPDVDVEYAGSLAGIEANWVSSTTNPTITTGYDSWSNPTHLEDSLGELTVTVYDNTDRRVGITHPTYTPVGGPAVTPTEAWAYDGNGNVSSFTSRAGDVTDFEYDGANRVTRQVDPAIPQAGADPAMGARGEHLTFYDRAGRVTQTVDPEGAVVDFGYDTLSRLRTETATVRAAADQPAQTAVRTSTYTWLGLPKTVTDPEGVVSTSSYNSHGETVSSTVGSLNPTSWLYDGAGRARKTTNPDGTAVVYSYDQAGRQI